MRLIVDTRESRVAEVLMKAGTEFTTSQLDLGDFQFQDPTTDVIMCIIERKTVADLISSITSGRYKEQKTRVLLSKPADAKYIMLVEGATDFKTGKEMVVGSILNSVFRDGVFVIQTKSIDDTCAFLAAIAKRADAKGAEFFQPTENTQIHRASIITGGASSSRKKDHVDPPSCSASQLCAIPGISVKKAKAISEHFNVQSMSKLCKALEDKGFENLGQVDGIGKVLVKNIVTFLGL